MVLISPKNLVANADGEGNIVLNWDPVGEVLQGNMVELYQHDEIPTNGMYQWFNIGYGVIFDLSAYPDATVEMVDFHHASWGITGIWSYMFHIVDWSTYTEIDAVGPFQTTGDDIWEFEIPLGSIAPTSNLVGIFLEPMSNDPQDAYPVLSCDTLLDGLSFEASLEDYTLNNPAPGDFLLDLWIWAPVSEEMVQPQKVKLNNLNANARKPFVPVNGDVIIDQKVKGGKALLGYNIYYAHESDPFEFLDSSVDTTYSHAGAGYIYGNHYYYLRSLYEEGESLPSDTAQEFISGISENALDNIQIYPNPVVDVINIKTDFDILSVLVVNSKGQVVLSEEGIKSSNYQINVANQPAGIFNIRIETENGWINRKMIKK